MRCLPPVIAPFRLISCDRRLDRTRKFTKPLLYRLSYVGTYFLMILALCERIREIPENSCAQPFGRDREILAEM